MLSLILLHFRVAFKASIFATSLVDLASEFHTTEPLYAKLFLLNSAFFRFTSTKIRLCLDPAKLKNVINL